MKLAINKCFPRYPLLQTKHFLVPKPSSSSIKNITQTAVINIAFQRIFLQNLTSRMLVYLHFQK